MAKKLTLEVDAETSKAKRKIQELAETGGAGGGGSGVPPASDRAARSLNQLGKAANEGSANLRGMTKMFGGMAIRMATSYAAQSMEKGSSGQMAVKSFGEVAGGALAGSAFGPLGAVAGGLMGLTSALMEASQAEKERKQRIADATFDYKRAERDYQSNKDFDSTMKGLTHVDKGFTDFAGRIEQINAELEKYMDVEDELKAKIEAFIQSGDLDSANIERSYLASNRSRQERLVAARERMEELSKDKKPAFRESMSAVDSLSRLGGNFGGGGDLGRDQLNVQREMASTLKAIESKTGGGKTWQ